MKERTDPKQKKKKGKKERKECKEGRDIIRGELNKYRKKIREKSFVLSKAIYQSQFYIPTRKKKKD